MKNAKNARFLHVFHIFRAVFGKKPLQKGLKIDQKSAKTPAFLCLLGRCTDFPDWLPTGFRLVPDFQKVVLEFAESGVKFWPEICRIGLFLRVWEVFWWVWGGWGLVWGCSGGVRGVVLGWLGRGFGCFGKVSGDFW